MTNYTSASVWIQGLNLNFRNVISHVIAYLVEATASVLVFACALRDLFKGWWVEKTGVNPNTQINPLGKLLIMATTEQNSNTTGNDKCE